MIIDNNRQYNKDKLSLGEEQLSNQEGEQANRQTDKKESRQ